MITAITLLSVLLTLIFLGTWRVSRFDGYYSLVFPGSLSIIPMVVLMILLVIKFG